MSQSLAQGPSEAGSIKERKGVVYGKEQGGRRRQIAVLWLFYVIQWNPEVGE